MFGWSINLFRIRGIQLAVHFSFILLLGYAAFEGWQDGGWIQLLWSVGILLAFFTCVVLHELGHSFTAIHFGIGVRRILLMPIGGMAEFDAIPRQPSRELLITLAGPAVNFAIAAILWPIVGFRTEDFPANATGFWQLLLYSNVFMGCFNILPAFPMDGGRILRALLAMRLPYLRATLVAATIGKGVCVIGIIVGFVWWKAHPLMPFLFAFIFAAGDAEYRALQRREQAEARWRDLSNQLGLPPKTAADASFPGP